MFVSRGDAYQDAGDYDHAISDYDSAVMLNSENVGAFANRGTAFAILGDYPRAIADYDQALKLKPDLAEIATSLRAASSVA